MTSHEGGYTDRDGDGPISTGYYVAPGNDRDQEKSTMNKSELAAAVAAKTELSASKAADVVNTVLEIITAEVKGGGKVTLQGFGTFVQKERAARTAKNPNTGATIQVAAKKVAKFTPGSGFQA